MEKAWVYEELSLVPCPLSPDGLPPAAGRQPPGNRVAGATHTWAVYRVLCSMYECSPVRATGNWELGTRN